MMGSVHPVRSNPALHYFMTKFTLVALMILCHSVLLRVEGRLIVRSLIVMSCIGSKERTANVPKWKGRG